MKTKAKIMVDELLSTIKIITDDYKSSEEEIELTCCRDEITGMVKDIGICPTCLEHI